MSIQMVLAQRLVRVNCPHCAEPYAPSAQLLADSGLADIDGFDLRAGRGCGQCRGTGYKGRKAVSEMLLLTDEIRELIVARAPIRALKEAAFRSGVKALRQAALDMARRGETTLEEMMAITELWVDTALQLGEKSLGTIVRVVRAQYNRPGHLDAASA